MLEERGNVCPQIHMYGYTHNSLPRPGETAVIFDTSARSGEIECQVNYSKNRLLLEKCKALDANI